MEGKSALQKKIYIAYPFREGPWGGGNQFLKALRGYLQEKEVYVESVEEADIILFNNIEAIMDPRPICKMRRQYPEKTFLLRIDGPTFLIRDENIWMDHGMNCAVDHLVDGLIFQTDWNRARCMDLGMRCEKPWVVLHNGSNCDIFYPASSEKNCTTGIQEANGRCTDEPEQPVLPQDRINVIATSWSNNWNKGFRDYRYLEQHLDSEKFRFVFVGNSPVTFEKGMQLPPQPSEELAKYLRSSQIFVTASRRDPCSNSLIEAMCCGLPAVVYRDGGHPELIGEGGKTFETPEEFVAAVEEVADKLQEYSKKVPVNDIRKVAQGYYDFALSVAEGSQWSHSRKKMHVFLAYPRFGWIFLERKWEKWTGIIKNKLLKK